jgi:hypothetical protein
MIEDINDDACAFHISSGVAQTYDESWRTTDHSCGLDIFLLRDKLNWKSLNGLIVKTT